MTATAEPQSLSRSERFSAGAGAGYLLPTLLLVASGMASLIFQVIWIKQLLLVGSPDPIALDWPKIRERFARPDTASALAEIGVVTPEALLATFVMDRAGLETFAGNAEAVTDDRPRIEYADWVRGRDFGSVLPDLLNLRTEPPLQNADPATLAAIDARRVELLTFYHAGMAAYAGDQPAWAADMRDVLAADPENPYYRWFASRAAE